MGCGIFSFSQDNFCDHCIFAYNGYAIGGDSISDNTITNTITTSSKMAKIAVISAMDMYAVKEHLRIM